MLENEIIANIIKHIGYIEIFSNGNSMYPTIKNGDKLKVMHQERYSINDIILFYPIGVPYKLICHRLCDVQKVGNQMKFITQGDARKMVDNYEIEYKNIIGKVQEINNIKLDT